MQDGTRRPERPLALIDVDGVLNPYAAPSCPPGYREVDLFPGEEPVRVRPGHGDLLRRLEAAFDPVWATMWEQDAPRLLGPLLGVEDYPVIEFGAHVPGPKLPGVRRAVGERPLVWFDDLHGASAALWAARRRAPTLLVPVDPARGLGRGHIDRAMAFAERAATGTIGPWKA